MNNTNKKFVAYEDWVLEQIQSSIIEVAPTDINSNAIIDVVELPTENINENAFYRLLSAEIVGKNTSTFHCYVVNNLPETGVYLDTNIHKVVFYYNVSDGNVYIYADEKGIKVGFPSIGWYPIEQLYQIITASWGGIITDINEAYNDDVTHHLLLTYPIWSYKDGKWSTVEMIGRKGDGIESVIFNDPANKTKGNYAHAQGTGTYAEGFCSHAEGYKTHSEAYGSHAEGCETCSQGNYSHTEGYNTYAQSWQSHAEGQGTIAACINQHVQGQYNIIDPEFIEINNSTLGKYAHIVGNGTSDDARSNAHTLDWDGLGWFAGGLKIGGTGQDDSNAQEVALKSDIPSIEGLATESYVDTQLAALVNSAPDKLDTLDELAAALGDDENFATTVTNQIADKVNKSELDSVIETALTAAKESGEFDGYSPIKGTDYWTDADKTEIVEEVKTAIPSEIPAYTEADYGKTLSCTAEGLVWIDPPTGGASIPSAEGVEF